MNNIIGLLSGDDDVKETNGNDENNIINLLSEDDDDKYTALNMCVCLNYENTSQLSAYCTNDDNQ